MHKFDPAQQFDHVSDAVDLINQEPSPIDALMQVIRSNVENGEFGFASDLVAEFGLNGKL